MFIYLLIFIASCVILAYAGKWLVQALSRIADFLGWKEFTVSFFIMSAATALPEFFVGVSSALRGVPELSFGNIIGQSIIHFTLAIGICALVAGSIKVESRAVRSTAWFSALMAVLPIALIADGTLSRPDGIILIASFVCFSLWLFSRKDNFSDTYHHRPVDMRPLWRRFATLLGDLGMLGLGVGAIIVAAQGTIISTGWFSARLDLPLVVVGAIVVGLGTAMPEVYFSAVSARQKHGGLMIGNLLGSTAVSVSMVLGAVALINPIVVPDMSSYLISRVFLIAAVALFLIFISLGRRITVKEGIVFFAVYILFIAAELIAGAL